MKRRLFIFFSMLMLVVCVSAIVPNCSQAAGKKSISGKIFLDKATKLKVKNLSKKQKAKGIIWESSDKTVATIESDGTVTGLQKGEVTISAQVADTDLTIEKTFYVDKYVSLKSITFTKVYKQMAIGEKRKLEAMTNPVNASYSDIKWKSSNPKVARVSGKGVIQGKKKGKAVITAYISGTKKKKRFHVFVQKNVKCKKVTVRQNKTVCNVGEKVQFTADLSPVNVTDGEVTWSVSKKKYASISDKGVLTSKKAGRITVYAKVKKGGKKAKAKLTMNAVPVKSVRFQKNNPVTMSYGSQRQFSVTIEPANATNNKILWKSSNNSMARVDQKGVVTALRPTESVEIQAISKENRKIVATWKLAITADKGYVTKKMLDDLSLDVVENVMIVAHPDDETLWGGSHLIDDEYLVIVMTNGWNATRKKNYQDVMKKTNDKYLILGYPDVKKYYSGGKYDMDLYSTSQKGMMHDIDLILSYKKWKKVVTHNPDGEYSKYHHKKVSQYTTDSFNRILKGNSQLYYFGKYYGGHEVIPGEQIPEKNLLLKRQLINMYLPTAQGAITAFGHMIPYENWILAENWH